MLKTLSYFLAAVVLIGTSMVLQITFDDGLKEYADRKKKIKRSASYSKEKPSKIDKEKGFNVEQDSSNFQNSDTLAFQSTPDTTFNDVDTLGQLENESFGISDFDNTSSDENSYFENLISSYLKPIVGTLSEGRSRDDVTIRYYTHEKDGDHVYALRTLGYYLHEKEAKETRGMESNVLIYGSDVDIRDIKIVAYTLLINEVPLRDIKPSRYAWKFHALEVGTNPSLESQSIMTLADIKEFELN